MPKTRRTQIPARNSGARASPPSTRQQAAILLHQAQSRFAAGAYDDAGAIARRVLDLDPGNADAFHTLGAVAVHAGNLDEAATLLAKAVNLNRNAPHVRHGLGILFAAKGDHEAAAETFRQALQLDGSLNPARHGLGAALRALGRPDEARVQLLQYLARVPNDADGHNEMALALRDVGDLERALDHFRLALKSKPDHASARSNLAQTLLLSGDFVEGWPAWLRTWSRIPLPGPQAAPALFDDKRVFIHGTEGVGDEIMYASCLTELAEHAAEVMLHCDERLVPLFQRSFPAVQVKAFAEKGTKRTIGFVGKDEIHFLASYLPAYFRHDPASFPSRPAYLRADPAAASLWRQRYAALSPGLKVGISWRGGVDPLNRQRRSIPLPTLVSALDVPGVRFVSLQYGEAGAEIEDLRARTGVAVHAWSDADPMRDLDFFGAQVAALDLVISVDNSTVHMAGALGTPTWVLLPSIPDWRWRMTGIATPWYPSLRLFRQQDAGDWESVLQEVRTVLRELAATDHPSTHEDGARSTP
jgi:Flp pilus assembly protein TadD